MARTEFGNGVEEFTRAIEAGPPYVVRFDWGGGADRREQEVVTAALAACFGVKTLGREQTIPDSEPGLGPLGDRIKYAFWLLRIFGLSLAFTRRQVNDPADDHVCRINMRVDRSKYREEYDED